MSSRKQRPAKQSISIVAMAKVLFLVSLVAGTFAGCPQFLAIGVAQETKSSSTALPQKTKNTPIIVELFTSQGCNSCPPADKLLSEIRANATKEQQPIYVLSFHVDYWNHLGWNDPFSNAVYSNRQRDYAAVMKNDRIYTPQMIVNGRQHFVGSDRKQADRVIKKFQAQRSSAQIDAKLNRGVGQHWNLNYQTKGSKEFTLNVALVTDPEATDVERGENANSTLQHVNVVHQFWTTIPEDTEGEFQFELPESIKESNLKDWRLICFLQDPRTFYVLGATEISFPIQE